MYERVTVRFFCQNGTQNGKGGGASPHTTLYSTPGGGGAQSVAFLALGGLYKFLGF